MEYKLENRITYVQLNYDYLTMLIAFMVMKLNILKLRNAKWWKETLSEIIDSR